MNERTYKFIDLSEPVNPTEDDLARFWCRVDKTNPCGCWIWISGISNTGYGAFAFDSGSVGAHRFSWCLSNGPIPKDKPWILHDCPGGDNPLCVNPAHLRPGTIQDNVKDAVKKGQVRSGGSHWAKGKTEIAAGLVRWIKSHPGYNMGALSSSAKLSDQDVRSIRERLTTGARGIGDKLANEYEISPARISAIKNGKAWQHVK